MPLVLLSLVSRKGTLVASLPNVVLICVRYEICRTLVDEHSKASREKAL